MVLNLGHRPTLAKNFIWLPFTPLPPPLVAPLVLQLVSEPVRSLIVLNRLCDLNVTWRKVPSSMWFSMVKILGIGRTEQGTTCSAKDVLFGRSYKQGTCSRQCLRMQLKVSCKGMITTTKP
jgi:hypothetical protein